MNLSMFILWPLISVAQAGLVRLVWKAIIDKSSQETAAQGIHTCVAIRITAIEACYLYWCLVFANRMARVVWRAVPPEMRVRIEHRHVTTSQVMDPNTYHGLGSGVQCMVQLEMAGFQLRVPCSELSSILQMVTFQYTWSSVSLAN